MKTFLGAVSVLVSAILVVLPASADQGYGAKKKQYQVQSYDVGEDYQDSAQYVEGYDNGYPVSEDEAASIAKDQTPGARVLKVKLLKSGVYAVTLKDGGNVSRVMVDATTGQIL